MADDRHYVGGEWYRICDRTGFKIRSPRTRMEWTNRIVRQQSWEPRQPQDFVQGVRDDQTVSDPRPRQIDQFQGPLATVTTVTMIPGSNNVVVQTNKRMSINDSIGIMQDDGVVHRAVITDLPSPTLIQFNPPVHRIVSAGNEIINYTAISNPVIIQPGTIE